MTHRTFPLKSLIAAMLLCGAVSAQAQITVYTERDAYLGAVGTYGVDDFDDLSVQRYDSPLSRNAGSFAYTVSAPGGLYPGGEFGDIWLSTNTRTDTVVFSNFAPGITGFGGYFFASDVFGGYTPNGSLLFTALDGTTLNYTLDNATTTSFLGFVSESPLVSVSLTSNGEYWPTANNLTLAMPVPEPSTYGMMALGLGLLAWRRRSS